MKRTGILLPVFSLPSEYGIGTFGKSAYEFVDFLAFCGQSFWQILPLSQTSFGDSPYQSPSAFAGNPYFIDPDILVEKGYLEKEDLAALSRTGECVDYAALYRERYPLLRRAFEGFRKKTPKDYPAFVSENAAWLEPYALYMALKNEYGCALQDFPREIIRVKDKTSLAVKYAAEMAFWRFVQYEFLAEWSALRAYANAHGVRIIGDIPIYGSVDSADVFAEPEQFLLDADLRPTWVAGVPPDAFSASGQLWGNPLYDWEYMKKDGYSFWIRRIAHAAKLYDRVRIDHFVGFSNYFAIPADAASALDGHIEKGPGIALFEAIRRAVPRADVIAEDLGMMQDGVADLLRATGIPGMRVVQFGFEGADNPHALAAIGKNSIVYTGTHDNPTALGFWQSLSHSKQCRFARKLPAVGPDIVDRIIAAAMLSPADVAIIPMQDYLHLGNEARINTPATDRGNWSWILPRSYSRASVIKRIRKITEASSRVAF